MLAIRMYISFQTNIIIFTGMHAYAHVDTLVIDFSGVVLGEVFDIYFIIS